MTGTEQRAAARGGRMMSVQALRACACLMVVGYHALRQAGLDWPNLSAGVDLFFVISGTVMARAIGGAPPTARDFLAARARRILPLYWSLTAVKLAIALVAPALTPDTAPTAWNAVASVLLIPSRNGLGELRPILPVGWTLQFEALFYGLLALALAARRPPAIIVPALSALALAGAFRQPDWPAPGFLCNGLVLEFAAGLAIAARPGRPWMLPAGLALLLAVPAAGPLRCIGWGGPAALTVAGALALEARCRIPRALLVLGDASYAIYLVHPLVLPAGALAAPFAVLAGLAVHRFLDAPLQRWFRQRRYSDAAKGSEEHSSAVRAVAPDTACERA